MRQASWPSKPLDTGKTCPARAQERDARHKSCHLCLGPVLRVIAINVKMHNDKNDKM